MNPPEPDPIVTYIREHRRTYTRQAITQQLQDAGYDRASVAAAWDIVEPPAPEELRRGPIPPPAGGHAILPFVVIWIGILVVLGVLQALTNVGLGSGTSATPGSFRSVAPTILNILFVIVEAGTLVGGIVLLLRGRPLGPVLAIVGVISFLWFVAVAGTCLAALQ